MERGKQETAILFSFICVLGASDTLFNKKPRSGGRP